MIEDRLADAYRFIREDGHRNAALLEKLDRFANSRVEFRMIDGVLAVIGEEEFKRGFNFLIGGFGSHGAADQDGRSVADIGED